MDGLGAASSVCLRRLPRGLPRVGYTQREDNATVPRSNIRDEPMRRTATILLRARHGCGASVCFDRFFQTCQQGAGGGMLGRLPAGGDPELGQDGTNVMVDR